MVKSDLVIFSDFQKFYVTIPCHVRIQLVYPYDDSTITSENAYEKA